MNDDPQELAHQFNDDEAVWRCFERRQKSRRHQKHLPPKLKKILDDFDWRMAEREAHPVRAIGKWIDL